MEFLEVRKVYREIFSSHERTSTFSALVTDTTGRGMTKFYCPSMAIGTPDSFGRNALYFFMERLYRRV